MQISRRLRLLSRSRRSALAPAEHLDLLRRDGEGRPAQLLVPDDMLHDFAYLPGIARAAIALLDAQDADCGQAWNMRRAPTCSLRALPVTDSAGYENTAARVLISRHHP